tara:strand:+ start:2384 stop:4678 length:2295 start_codon:yes stop_codon:yes gene_type:complete
MKQKKISSLFLFVVLVFTPLFNSSYKAYSVDQKDFYLIASDKNDRNQIVLKFLDKTSYVEIIVTGINGDPILSERKSKDFFEVEIGNKNKQLISTSQSLSIPESGILNASLSGNGDNLVLKIIPTSNFSLSSPKVIKEKDRIAFRFNKSTLSKNNNKKNIFSLQPIIPREINSSTPTQRAIAPPLGDIATGTSSIFNPNLIDLKGPNVSLVLNQTPAREAIDFLFSKVDYGFVWVQANPTYMGNYSNKSVAIEDLSSQVEQFQENNLSTENSSMASGEITSDSPRLITLSIKDKSFSTALNSILMASGLQAKIDNNIIYIGPNVRDTVFVSRVSKVYRLNQTTANAAASYLANLGAKVTKTSTITTAVTTGASESESVSGGSSSATTTSGSTTSVQVYGSDIGPLVGLIATTDDRLQTITLIGSKQLVNVAESYIKQLDLRQRQVALTVRILDINIADGNTFNHSWAFKQNKAFIVNAGGTLLGTWNRLMPPGTDQFASGNTSELYKQEDVAIGTNPTVTTNRTIFESPGNDSRYGDQEFINFLRGEIISTNTKILASPTLILSEYPGKTGGESVSFSDVNTALTSSTIGRSYGNEAFVMVGSQVPINCTAEGESAVPSFTYGIAGLTFGARVERIDDNGFVTINISPAVSASSGTRPIEGCGDIDLLATRRLDSGSIRIRDGNTLILTGVLTTEDKETVSKWPLLGDIPLIGRLFRNTSTGKTQRELVILVTPQILKGSDSNEYLYKPSTEDVKNLIEGEGEK